MSTPADLTTVTWRCAALRDAPLPKLIRGEIRVPDIERSVGRCV
jgi:hypothetical protein